MRLFRRSLLCLVVGVTAFGVAGWGFRPRANWSTVIPFEYSSFAETACELSDDDPIWIAELSDEILAVDPRNGSSLRTYPRPETGNTNPTFAVVEGGRLLLDRTNVDATPDERRFQLFDSNRSDPLWSSSIPVDWNLTRDSLHAWRLHESEDERFIFELRELQNEGTIRRFDLTKIIESVTKGYFDYSAESDLIAFSQRIRVGSKPPYGIELRQASTGNLVKILEIDVPENRRKDGPEEEAFRNGPQNIVFHRGGRLLSFILPETHSNAERVYLLDVDDGSIRLVDPPKLPPEAVGLTDIEFEVSSDRQLALALNQLEPPAGWISLLTPNEKSPTWLRFPFPLIVHKSEATLHQKWMLWGGVKIRRVPLRNQLVVGGLMTQISTAVPTGFRWLLPSPPADHESVWNYWWLDGPSGQLRAVGCNEGASDVQVRPTALLTLREGGDETTILQSWPLPPRDPKWPALGVAALCMAGTWWACARRYRRRMLASRSLD